MQRAEIIAIGTELLLGGRLDTNSLFLVERLAALGIEVRFKSVVGDEKQDIASALRTASRRADVVLLTGGLGPTVDDCTRQAVAQVTGRSLRQRKDALESMRQRLAAWGRIPSQSQLRQALIPVGAEVLFNPVGSAPGFALTWNGCLVAALPGVPREAEEMFDVSLAPRLATEKVMSKPRAWIERRVLQTFGLIESEVDQRLEGLVQAGSDVRLGLLASPMGVSVSLTACVARSSQAATKLLDDLVQEVRRRLGSHVYAEGADSMEMVVGRLLTQHHFTLSLAESCTGGLIGHRLTQVPGSSSYFDRGIICYSNEAKHELLDVPLTLLRRYGAVSAEVAASMAKGARRRSRADIGLSVTGIAGPGGATDHKPVGLVYIGLDAAGRGLSRRFRTARITQMFRFHGDRQTVKLRASQAALDMLRRWLLSARAQR